MRTAITVLCLLGALCAVAVIFGCSPTQNPPPADPIAACNPDMGRCCADLGVVPPLGTCYCPVGDMGRVCWRPEP